MDSTLASKGLLPSNCAGFTLDKPDVWHLAWHPLHSACIYMLVDWDGGLHCIDARASRCVKSWTEAELHDHQGGEAHPGYIGIPHALKWSPDGSKLAVASGPRCSLLHFQDMCK